MSQSRIVASSSKFQPIINNALKAYQKRTKKDLLVHPLASQLQACDSSSDIIALLQQQVRGLDQSRNDDNRWTKWLDPTINVIFAFSATLGADVGMVCPRAFVCLRSVPLDLFGRDYHLRPSSLLGSVFSFQCVSSNNLACVIESYISQAAKDVRASQDTLLDIFGRIEMFFQRLETYTGVPPTAEMMDIIIQIMVAVLSILGIAMKEIKQCRISE
jgi:hypothetical protein